MLDKELKTLQDRTRTLNDQCDNKSILVDKASQKLELLDRDIVVVKQSIISIDVDINDAER